MRTIISLLVALAAVLAFTPPATAAAGWGPYRAPGDKARASGTLVAVGEDHDTLPTADQVTVKGTLTDRARPAGTCAWLLMQFAVRVKNAFVFKERKLRDCSYRTPKHFTYVLKDVYQVELKVCSEAKSPAPSAHCRYSGTWKIIYTSPL
ncbi:hypothetical protein [Nonomuraea sp. NPDC050310]|uniref:hypothetical protein n=1 Tax=Nonomuraea sp. NPDC050310 TaxID=3154935 RepID=UPI0033C31456